ADLIELVLANTSIERLRITSVGPHEIDERFISIVNQPRVAPHLHLALQSGSPTVLKRMKRWYNLQQYRRAVRRLKQEIPEIGITTDVIVGFPGETEAEFEESYQFVREMGFAKLHVFPFSARRGTAAAGYPDQVPAPVKARRSARLRELGEELHASFLNDQFNRDVDVLLEHEVHADGVDGKAIWSGLTGNYARVYVPVEPGTDYSNRFVRARTVDRYEDGLLAGQPAAIW
ncbi:MAG TPA: radical SAM protein, partial [Thermomicrobiaceae bacterium]|nr:radical SAM protein [Thermomicrobiaceae bacterium]